MLAVVLPRFVKVVIVGELGASRYVERGARTRC